MQTVYGSDQRPLIGILFFLFFTVTHLTPSELKEHFTAYDLKRMHSYAQNLIDFHAIMDLLPGGEAGGKMKQVQLTAIQA